jgi:hypothetical protein
MNKQTKRARNVSCQRKDTKYYEYSLPGLEAGDTTSRCHEELLSEHELKWAREDGDGCQSEEHWLLLLPEVAEGRMGGRS